MEMSHNARVKFKKDLATNLTKFMNTCHGDDGKFCEIHGIKHADEAQKWWTLPPGPERTAAMKADKDRKMKALAEDKKNAGPVGPEETARIQAVEKARIDSIPNKYGFTPAQLEEEKEKIKEEVKKSQSRNLLVDSWTAKVDAEIRAKAVLEGRIADKKEIKKNRNSERSSNWGGLLAIGIAAHYLRK